MFLRYEGVRWFLVGILLLVLHFSSLLNVFLFFGIYTIFMVIEFLMRKKEKNIVPERKMLDFMGIFSFVICLSIIVVHHAYY